MSTTTIRTELFTEKFDVAAATLLVIQHNGDNGPGIFGELACKPQIHRSDLNPKLPTLDGVDGLVVLGGPQTSFSDVGFPARKAEIALLKKAVAKNIPTLGVCLGAQLLTLALGGKTYRREEPEIGYLPVTLTEEGRKDALFDGCPPVFAPRHRHFDSFELPPGTVRLASSEQCAEQGFRYGDRVWGLQFHFEMDQRAEALALKDPSDAASIIELAPVAQRIMKNFCAAVSAHAIA